MSTSHRWIRVSLVGLLASALCTVAAGRASAEPTGFVPVAVARLLDTRPGFATVDGTSAGIGRLPAGSITEVQATGRAGISEGTSSVALTVTVTGASRPGFVTVYPCGPVPGVSTVNFAAGQTIAGSAVSALDANGRFCVFAMTDVDVIVDVTGSFTSAITALPPGRLFDSRRGYATTDGQQQAGGALAAGSVTVVHVGGRLGVPLGAEAAALTITVTEPTSAGFVSAYPCGPRPLVSTVNHVAGQTISNAGIVPLDANGDVCMFTVSPTHLVVDVTAAVPAGSPYTPVAPARLADTRFDGVSIDGTCSATGRPRSGSTMTLVVAGRAGIPATGVGAVVVNVTTLGAKRPGFLTAFTPERGVPNASSINFASDDLVSNSVIVPVDSTGAVSLFVNTSSHVIVDIMGWLPGASGAPGSGGCAGQFVDPRPGPDRHTSNYLRSRCAIETADTLVCWSTSQLGAVSSGYAEVTGFGSAVELADSAAGMCALRKDGTVACATIGHVVVGGRFLGPITVLPLTSVVGLESLYSVTCAVDALGSLWCWMDGVSPVRVPLPARALSMFDGASFDSLVVRLDNGTVADLVPTNDASMVAMRANPASFLGHPWRDVVAVTGTYPFTEGGSGCVILVDGRAACDASTVDLAPDMDIVFASTSLVVGADGAVRTLYDDPHGLWTATRMFSWKGADCAYVLGQAWCIMRATR